MSTVTTIAPYSDEFYALAHSEEPIRESYFAPVWEACGRCAGYGGLSHYTHVDNGICYQCHGSKGGMVSAKTQASRCRTERKNHRKVAEARAAEEEYMAMRTQWAVDNADVVTSLADMKGDFAADMRVYLESYGTLTENQTAAVRRIAQEAARRAESAVEVPEGRQAVTGKIISIKRRESDYGVTWRATIDDDRGFRVNGNLPQSLITDLFTLWQDEIDAEGHHPEHWAQRAQGERVTFTATLAQRSPGFGFFKRPSKASVL